MIDPRPPGGLPGEGGDALIDQVTAGEPAVALVRRRLAGVQLEPEIDTGLGRGLVHPLAEILESLLAASVAHRKLGGVQGGPEQEPPVVG
jgi:hypothetical protein